MPWVWSKKSLLHFERKNDTWFNNAYSFRSNDVICSWINARIKFYLFIQTIFVSRSTKSKWKVSKETKKEKKQHVK